MKIPIKIVLSRVPVARSVFRKFSIFNHGEMDNPVYAFGVVNKHYKKAKPWLKDKKFVALELGPGDSLLSALNISAMGASKCYLVDNGEYATKEIERYRHGYAFLQEKGYVIKSINKHAKTVEGFFKDSNLEYLTNGLESLRTIPDQSIDFIWSHAVLEHIRLAEFDEMMLQFYRILKPKGVCSHVIDYKDHLGEGLNNLRFSHNIWESDFFSNSGFYTNRIRHDQMIESFKKAGFKTQSHTKYSWDNLPLAKIKLNHPYNSYTKENLLIYEADIVLTK